MNITIDTAPVEQLSRELSATYGSILSYEISDAASATRAGDALRDIGNRMKSIEEKRKEITRPLDAAKAAIMDIFRPALEQAQRVQTVIRSSLLSFQEAEQRKLDEQRRIADEKARKEEEQRRKELAAEAQRELDAGRTCAALEKIEQAKSVVVIAEPVVQPMKPVGVGVNKRWTFEILNASLLPREYMMPNETMLKALATSMKEKAQLPGVRFFAAASVGLRAAR